MTVRTIILTDPRKPNPVNSLGSSTRLYLYQNLQLALSDPEVTSVVLIGAGKNFSAGADIREFATGQSGAGAGGGDGGGGGGGEEVANLVELLCRLIESSPKPVIAAIRGVALGGGLVLALACHYRVADAGARVGLPEVKIGLIPGAGGTQRLPRLCGVEWSLGVMTSGRNVAMDEGLRVGLIDGVAKPGETLEECAGRWAEYAAIMPPGGRVVSRRAVRGRPSELARLCDRAEAKLPKPDRGGEAARAAVKAVRASFERSKFEEGMEAESELFMDLLLNSVQGRARRHAFFAERAAQATAAAGGGRSAGRSGPGPGEEVARMVSNPSQVSVGVVGAGTMGSGIALTFLRAGYAPVVLVDNSQAGLDRGVELIKKLVRSDVGKKRISARAAENMVKALKPSTDPAALKDCSLIVEAAFENLEVKRGIFGKLNAVARPDAYLCSNTSTLDIDVIASALSPERRGRCAGMHFFSPAHVMRLVEIVRGSASSDVTLAVLRAMTKKMRKVGVTVGNCDGFVGNRMLHPYTSEMLHVVEEGGETVPGVDKALTAFGMAIGPFVMSDLAGNDIGLNIRREKGLAKDPTTGRPGPNRVVGMRYTDLGDDLVIELGRVGQKAGKGWYTYDHRIGRGRAPLPSSEVAAFIAARTASSSSPDKGRRLNRQEIVERLLYPLVNEGFKILEEGIARDPADIDVIYLYGYGWPVWRGGPMFWADNEVGLPRLLSRLEEFHERYPGSDYYSPSALLRKCVAMDVGIQEYYRKGYQKSGASLSKL